MSIRYRPISSFSRKKCRRCSSHEFHRLLLSLLLSIRRRHVAETFLYSAQYHRGEYIDGGERGKSNSGEEAARISSEEKLTALELTGIIIIIIIIVIITSKGRTMKTGERASATIIDDPLDKMMRVEWERSAGSSFGSLKFIFASHIECNAPPPPYVDNADGRTRSPSHLAEIYS